MEGTDSKGYDVVLSIRDRGGNFNVLANKYSREASTFEEFSGVDPKNKVHDLLPCKHTSYNIIDL